MYRPRKENPSFSSSLLDEIYRSIDERDDKEEVKVYRETTSQKHSSVSTTRGFQNDRRETIEKIMVRRKLAKDFNSSSSSSGSSCGGGFSSSETESVYKISSRPKPIRTSIFQNDEHKYGPKYQSEHIQTISKHEGKFVKTKSRAMKIYGDLKKVKQPISPGGRLATFLNSIFNTKTKPESVSSNVSSTCSSASSFSRSCLSNTSSSRTKLNTNKKHSVRFFPMMDGEFKPCGNKTLHEQQSSQVKFVKNPKLEEKSCRIEEAARTLLRNYQKKVECEFDLSKGHKEVDMKYEDDDDDDDDDVSNASSDLFELKNFDEIGMVKYGDELPVYETTHLDMNLAIGNGFLM